MNAEAKAVILSIVSQYCPNISKLSPCNGNCEGCQEEVLMVVQAMKHLTLEQLEALGLLARRDDDRFVLLSRK